MCVEAIITPFAWRVWEELQMHRICFCWETPLPDFLRGKAHDRREPDCEALKHQINNRQIGTAARAGFRVTIGRIFANIEIEGGQLNIDEIIKLIENRFVVMI